MIRYIALFRALNVGGKNRLSMTDLVATLTRVGCTDVQTYIQSGNAVFACDSGDAAALTSLIREEQLRAYGMDAGLLLLTPSQLKRSIENNPFAGLDADPSTIHLGFLAARPLLANLDKLANLKSASEQYFITGSVFYLYAPDGIGRSKLAAYAERLLGVPMTDRNWRTVMKLWEMVQSGG
jgi:uncharacterized protein (DUF1697 family)